MDPIGKFGARFGKLSLAARLVIVTAAMALLAGALLPVASARNGAAGVQAVILAAVVCCISANLALYLSVRWQGTPQAVNAALAGLLVNMMLPLGVGAAAHFALPELAAARVLLWVLAFYLTALVIKTPLALAPVGDSNTGHPTARTTSTSGT